MQVIRRKIKDPLSYLDNHWDSKSKVKDFLDSKARNSQKTSNAYSFGLKHFSEFLDSEYGHLVTIGNIIDKIKTNEIDLYIVINKFVSYLAAIGKLTNRTVNGYVAAIRTYLQFHDIDIIPQKFKNRVPIPKEYHEEEQAIDHEDIREILKACTNRRLKTYLYVLASGGMRANEALALRLKDVHFEESPTKVNIRKENKTRRPRDIYISDEATKYLNQWIDHKYRKRRIGTKMVTHEKSDNDLIFTLEFDDSIKPTTIYPRIMEEFHKVLKTVNLNEIKEGSYSNRRKITLNSFRRFVYSTISGYDPPYAEWFLGHNKSPYWTVKEEKRKETYVKCMKALTFLDFSGIETITKNIETQVQVLTESKTKQEEEIWNLRKIDTEREDILQSLVKAVEKLKADKGKAEKKMKEVTKKLEEIEKEEEAAMWAWEAAQAEAEGFKRKVK
jgi:integrase